MTPRGSSAQRAKAAAKRQIFVQAYLANGRNATLAARTAGYSAATACVQGSRLLKRPDVHALIAAETERHSSAAGLTIERTLAEVAAAAYATVSDDFRWPDKLRAIELAMRHLGLFERDNQQRGANLALQIVLVGPQ